MMVFSGKQFRKAMEAIKFYQAVFEDSEILKVSYQEEMNGPVSFALFSLAGQYFMAMDSTDELPVFTEAISSIILCKNQEEVDYYWGQFLEDGFYRQASAWIRDKYGLWWQLIHFELSDMMRTDQKTVKSVIEEMDKSEKIDVERTKRALK